MTDMDFAKAMGNIDEELIAMADDAAADKRKNRYTFLWRWAAAAVLVILVFLASQILTSNGTDDSNVPITEESSHNAEASDDAIDNTQKTEDSIYITSLSQGTASEFAGDMHRPEGFSPYIGSALALKMSIVSDPDYQFSVLIQVDKDTSLEQIFSQVNEHLHELIRFSDVKNVVICDGNNTVINDDYFSHYFLMLTSDQITVLADAGVHCSYVGSGQGEYKDMSWDTPKGIDTYCELNGDMYVFHDDGSIQCSPDSIIF